MTKAAGDASLNQAMAERDGQIAAPQKSISWRITSPLSIVGHPIQRVRLAELVMPVIKRRGGLKNTFIKAIHS
ncbi:hypothetical protein ACFQAT_22310 [Undibacterium arcticum]|uniref:Uncharacterized protein n=1 Tax=Undibacterium arcticum TaxID=1762892 RepID=A0ABV7F8D2_9BURK